MTEAPSNSCLFSVAAWNVGGFPHNLGGNEVLWLCTTVIQASHKILS